LKGIDVKLISRILLLMVLILVGRTAAFDFKIPVHYDTLPNGLRVIVVVDTNVAVVSCRLYYFVGSMYEGPGTSGLSHMYEHMMFKGTKRLGTTNYPREKRIIDRIDSVEARIGVLMRQGIPESDSSIQELRKKIFSMLDDERTFMKKDEIWDLYQKNGGTQLNAWTADDMTAYIVTMPTNKVELFYWIESDRMANPVLREFFSERDVVTEERRMRYENRPIYNYYERLNALFYVAHPYRQPTIGWMSDIRAYTRQTLEDHIKKFYTPDNAVIVLNGNIDPAKALTDIRRYFGPIPRAARPKQEVVTREPAPIGETRFTVHDNAQPRIDIMFHTPGYPHDDLFKLDLVEGVLSGRSGRLYKRLVTDEKLCTDASASNNFRLHDSYFELWATLQNNADPLKVERIMMEELTGIAQKPPSAAEMDRIKNKIQMSFVSQLKSLEGLSDQLAWFERMGSWRDLMEYPDKIAAITSAMIPAVVKQYFKPELKTIGMLLPASSDTIKEPQ
jgi:predicted Zn-dependent peptidase